MNQIQGLLDVADTMIAATTTIDERGAAAVKKARGLWNHYYSEYNDNAHGAFLSLASFLADVSEMEGEHNNPATQGRGLLLALFVSIGIQELANEERRANANDDPDTES